METNHQNDFVNSGTIFVGCMFIGLGPGFLFNGVTPGVLIGMGVGFITKSANDRKANNQNSDNS